MKLELTYVRTTSSGHRFEGFGLHVLAPLNEQTRREQPVGPLVRERSNTRDQEREQRLAGWCDRYATRTPTEGDQRVDRTVACTHGASVVVDAVVLARTAQHVAGNCLARLLAVGGDHAALGSSVGIVATGQSVAAAARSAAAFSSATSIALRLRR